MTARKAPEKKDPAANNDQPIAPTIGPVENLSLWDKVSETNPAYTKGFSKGGGFKGTSTNMTYQIFRATQLWGPMGGAWGAMVHEESYVDGHEIHSDGAIIGKSQVHVIRLRVWYPNALAKAGVGLCTVDGTGVIEHFGQTEFVGKNKNGVFTDEEAPKKSFTDALSKCLSNLGFSADIFLGLYDDNKYVNDKRATGDKYEAMGNAPDAQQGNQQDQQQQGQLIGNDQDQQFCTPGQIERLKAKLAQAGREVTPQVLSWMKTDKIENVHPIAYEKAIKSLDAEIAKNAANNAS